MPMSTSRIGNRRQKASSSARAAKPSITAYKCCLWTLVVKLAFHRISNVLERIEGARLN